MKPLMIILVLLAFNKCKSNEICYNSDKLSDGFYYGSVFNVDVFIKISGDTAIAEWFYVEVIPRESFTDTLIINNVETYRWSGKTSSINKNKNQIYFETKRPYYPKKIMRVKIKLTVDDSYKKTYEVYKNRIFINKEITIFFDDAKVSPKAIERRQLWNKLYKDYQIEDKVSSLKSKDFLSEYAKFTKDLFRQLLLIEK